LNSSSEKNSINFMTKFLCPAAVVLLGASVALVSAPQDTAKKGSKSGGAKKVEMPHPFYWAAPDPLRGDWQGEGGYVAQVIRAEDRILSVADQIPQQEDNGKYHANIFRKFDQPNDQPVAVLDGTVSGSVVTFVGDGWEGSIEGGHFKAKKGDQALDLQHINRTPPSIGRRRRWVRSLLWVRLSCLMGRT
jgi:hypothetical protein